MNYILSLSLMLFIFSRPVFSQETPEIDSLKHIYQAAPNESVKVDLYYNLAREYFKRNLDSAFLYTNKSLELAQEINYKKGLANATSNMGRYYFMTNQLDSALVMVKKHLRLQEEIGDKSLIAKAYLSVGAVNSNSGNLEEGMRYYQKSIELYTELNNQKQLVKLYGNIVVICRYKGDFARGLDYQLKALQTAIKINDDEAIGDSYFNAGLLYSGMKRYQEAYEAELKAIEYRKKLNNLVELYEVYINCGSTLINLGRYEEGIEYCQKAVELIEQTTKNKSTQSLAYMNMSDAYSLIYEFDSAQNCLDRALEALEGSTDKRAVFLVNQSSAILNYKKGNLSKAEVHGRKVLSHLEEFPDIKAEQNAHHLLAKVLDLKGDYKRAYYHLGQHKILLDSLVTSDNIAKMSQLEAKFEHEKELQILDVEKKNEAILHEKEIEFNKRVGLILILVLFFVILGLIYLYRNYLQKKKADAEKDILLKEIHHRVKNNLQIVSSLLDLQSNSIEDESAITAIADGQNRVKAMALIHQKLYQNEDIARIEFKEYAEQLISQISSINIKNKDVQFSVVAQEVTFDIDTAIPLGLILSELITNAYKYAFNGDDQGQIRVSLAKLDIETYQLVVEDNGPGLSEDFDVKKAKSLGLRLVRRLSKQLYGKADYEYCEGARFTIDFKDTAARREIS